MAAGQSSAWLTSSTTGTLPFGLSGVMIDFGAYGTLGQGSEVPTPPGSTLRLVVDEGEGMAAERFAESHHDRLVLLDHPSRIFTTNLDLDEAPAAVRGKCGYLGPRHGNGAVAQVEGTISVHNHLPRVVSGQAESGDDREAA
jgi:hypothetical protein